MKKLRNSQGRFRKSYKKYIVLSLLFIGLVWAGTTKINYTLDDAIHTPVRVAEAVTEDNYDKVADNWAKKARNIQKIDTELINVLDEYEAQAQELKEKYEAKIAELEAQREEARVEYNTAAEALNLHSGTMDMRDIKEQYGK